MAHNSDINIQLLFAVFFLAQRQGIELCYDTEDGNLYEVKARNGEDVTLLPIGGGGDSENDTPIFNLNPSRLVFRSGLSAYSQNIAIETHTNAIGTQPQRTDARSANAGATLAEREIIISEPGPGTTGTQPAHNYIGAGKVDLPKFSMMYTGETARWAAEVETLLDKIFAATNYPKTIEKTIGNYNAAKKYAKNGQVYELKQLAERLQGRINKQGAMAAAMNTMAAQQAARRKMIFSAVAVIIIAVLYFGLGHFNKSPTAAQTQHPTAATTQNLSELDKAIMEWEQQTGKKIYPKGRECLAKTTVGMNKDQIIKVIQQNIK